MSSETQNRTSTPLSYGLLARALRQFGLAVLAILVLLAMAVIGVVRLREGISDGSISVWRLTVLVASLFGCLASLATLYGRGREPARPRSIGRGRSR